MLKAQCKECGAFICRVIADKISPGTHVEFHIEARCPNRRCKLHKGEHYSRENFIWTDANNLPAAHASKFNGTEKNRPRMPRAVSGTP